MKRLAWGALVLGGLMLVASLVLGVVAVWTVGSDAGRWGATAFIVGFSGLAVAFLASLWLDVESTR